ncbi:hypothetical protein ACLOJK_040918 [Asimina triloba]
MEVAVDLGADREEDEDVARRPPSDGLLPLRPVEIGSAGSDHGSYSQSALVNVATRVMLVNVAPPRYRRLGGRSRCTGPPCVIAIWKKPSASLGGGCGTLLNKEASILRLTDLDQKREQTQSDRESQPIQWAY